METYFDDQLYKGLDFTKKGIVKGEYDHCTFEDCDFSNVHASNIGFVECEFVNCNFSNTIVENTAFKTVSFKDCKMIGVKFQSCDSFLLSLTFENCQLNVSSFYKLPLKNTQFINCKLHEVDFEEANLSNARFEECDLKNAIFKKTNLEKTDFKTAFNFSINPAENNIIGAMFSQKNVSGLLDAFKISVT